MSPAELDQIEAELGVKLPAAYRQTCVEFPFTAIGGDTVYWFHNTPESVIGATRYPLDGSDYRRENWRAEFVAIGDSPCGDVYVLNTADENLPVLCLSHETHEFETEWGTFAEFVEEWQRPSTAELDKDRQAEREFWRRWRLVMAVILLFLLLFGVLPIVIANWMQR